MIESLPSLHVFDTRPSVWWLYTPLFAKTARTLSIFHCNPDYSMLITVRGFILPVIISLCSLETRWWNRIHWGCTDFNVVKGYGAFSWSIQKLNQSKCSRFLQQLFIPMAAEKMPLKPLAWYPGAFGDYGVSTSRSEALWFPEHFRPSHRVFTD